MADGSRRPRPTVPLEMAEADQMTEQQRLQLQLELQLANIAELREVLGLEADQMADGSTCPPTVPLGEASLPPLRRRGGEVDLCGLAEEAGFPNLLSHQAGQAGGVSMDLEETLDKEDKDFLKALNVEADVVEAGQMLTGQQQQELAAAQGELAAAAAVFRVFQQQQGEFDAAANAVQQLQQMAERLALEGVSLPMLLQDKGDLLAATELLLREALEAQRETLGARHPDTLKSICNLSKLLQDKGDLRRREISLLATSEHARHHEQLRRLKGDLDAAEPLLREVLETQRQTLGARHPDTLASMNSLGMLLYDKGELAAAEPLLREAKEWWSL